jgi:hypothetical protein
MAPTQELRQIHKLRSVETMKFVEDPQTGRQQKQRVQQYIPDDTDRISSDGETYEVQPDGSFFVPADLAAFLANQPDWHEGPNPFAPADKDEEKPRGVARHPKAA